MSESWRRWCSKPIRGCIVSTTATLKRAKSVCRNRTPSSASGSLLTALSSSCLSSKNQQKTTPVSLLRISIPLKVCHYGRHYNRWCLWTVAFLAKNHTCIDKMCFNIIVLTRSSFVRRCEKKLPEVTLVENTTQYVAHCFSLWYNSYRVMENTFGANVSILIVWWIPCPGAMVALLTWAHSTNWLRLDWRLNPYRCY